MRLLNNTNRAASAAVAQVTFSDSAGFGAAYSSEARGIPVFAPRGVAYQPCEGDRLLMMPVNGADVCVGCLSQASGIKAGELRLASSGGAWIHLKNNGDIVMNGLTITKDGKIAESGEESL